MVVVKVLGVGGIGVHGDASLERDGVVVLVVRLTGYEHVLAVEGVDAVAATGRQYRHLLHG